MNITKSVEEKTLLQVARKISFMNPISKGKQNMSKLTIVATENAEEVTLGEMERSLYFFGQK